MDVSIQGCIIIGTFALAHERVLELLRWFMEELEGKPRAALDAATTGAWSMFVGIVLSLATSANVFDAFRVTDGEPAFFQKYLHHWNVDSGRWWVGCAIMGMAVTLGSSFWHDLAKGLSDVRKKLKESGSLPSKKGSGPTKSALQQVEPDAPTPTPGNDLVQAA